MEKGAKKVVKGVKKGAEKVAEYVKDQKKEILISAAVVAVVIGAYVLAEALSGGAAGAEGVDGTNRKREDEEDPIPTEPESSPPHEDPPVSEQLVLTSTATSPVETSKEGITSIFQQSKMAAQAYAAALQPETKGSFSVKSAFDDLVDIVHRGIINSNPVPPEWNEPLQKNILLPSRKSEPRQSCYTRTEGIKLPGIQIGFINGMNTSFKEHHDHLNYLKQFA